MNNFNDTPNISSMNSYSVQPNIKKMTEEEKNQVMKDMKIPERDETKYPMPNSNDIELAGSFLWKMNLLASSYDDNMKALIWDLYVSMDQFIKEDPENVENEKMLGLNTLVNLNKLKLYIKESDNPIFKNNN